MIIVCSCMINIGLFPVWNAIDRRFQSAKARTKANLTRDQGRNQVLQKTALGRSPVECIAGLRTGWRGMAYMYVPENVD